MANRYDFTKKVKEVIAGRAGYRCSFVGCNALLIGPVGNEYQTFGECAHIYAAKGRGPRGQADLSEEAIKSAGNGIYLCKTHHKLIDSKEGCQEYDAQTLLLMKQEHEYNISCEIGIQQRPMTLIKHLTFVSHPFFGCDKTFKLTKITILEGGNDSGKTAFIETLYSILTGEDVAKRWKKNDIEVILSTNPVSQNIRYQYHENVTRYFDADNHQIGFCPYNIEVFYLRDKSYTQEIDDIKSIANRLGIDDLSKVKTMVESADLEDSIIVSEIGNITEEYDDEGKKYECLPINIKSSDITFRYSQLSTSQQNGFLLDLVSGYMKSIAKYKNAILLIDWGEFESFDDKWKNDYLRSLQKTGNKVQVIITARRPLNEIKVGGWNIIKLQKKILLS